MRRIKFLLLFPLHEASFSDAVAMSFHLRLIYTVKFLWHRKNLINSKFSEFVREFIEGTKSGINT